jgi:hypothetical protein
LFTRYDHDVTPMLVDYSELKVGDYVASKIGSTLVSAYASMPATLKTATVPEESLQPGTTAAAE